MKKTTLLCFLSLFIIASGLYADPSHVHEWDPKGYVQNSNSQQEDGEAVLRRIFRDYTESYSGTILDVGCRDGRITFQLAEHFPDATVVGIEKSQSMIDHALAMHEDMPHLTFKKESLDSFQLKKPADLVVSIFTLNWVENFDGALKNLNKNMATDGKLYAIFSATKEGLPFQNALNKVVAERPEDFKNFVNPQYFYDTEVLRAKLTNAGFHVLAIYYKYNSKVYSSETALRNWIQQWLPQAKYLPQEKRDEFMNAVIKEYLVQSHQDPASHHINWNEYVISIEASKP